MSIKQDRVELFLELDHNKDRKIIRDTIIKKWLLETQKKNRYFVETLVSGKKIYLERPAKIGFKNPKWNADFIIFVEDQWLYKKGTDKAPTYDQLYEILRELKKSSNSKDKEQIFNCFQKLHSNNFIPKKITIPCNTQKLELALKLTRWFFIEQDINYWHGEGRDMLFGGIKKLWKEQ